MKATEQIVRSYYEHIHGLYTRPNIKGCGQCELDLIAVKTAPVVEYWHVETTVSIADGFSRISNDKYDPEKEKERVQSAAQKKTAGYFIEKKFYAQQVMDTYQILGMENEKVKRVVVAWDFEDSAATALRDRGIEPKSIKTIFQELANHLSLETSDLDNDILKTLQLLVRAKIDMPEVLSNATARKRRKANEK